MNITYWGIFVGYLGVWYLIWRMAVVEEAM